MFENITTPVNFVNYNIEGYFDEKPVQIIGNS